MQCCRVLFYYCHFLYGCSVQTEILDLRQRLFISNPCLHETVIDKVSCGHYSFLTLLLRNNLLQKNFTSAVKTANISRTSVSRKANTSMEWYWMALIL